MKKNSNKPTALQSRIIKMLKENTGRHMLDSGGAYGRNWERNQSRNFMKEPELIVSTWNRTDKEPENVCISINLFHYLCQHLEITTASEKHDKRLQRILKKPESDRYDIDIMEEYAEKYKNITTDVETINTYNHDSFLSQGIQFTTFTDEESGEEIVLLQIHGGCDVRGGYTAPRAFSVRTEGFKYEHYWLDIYCSDGKNEWVSRENTVFEISDASESNTGDEYDETVFCHDGIPYSKRTGKKVCYYAYIAGTEFSGQAEGPEEVEFIPEIRKFVQENYQKENVVELAEQRFDLENEYGFVKQMANRVIKEIEDNTLEMTF